MKFFGLYPHTAERRDVYVHSLIISLFWTFFPKNTTKIYRFETTKICNVIFWIGNDPPFGTFPKKHAYLRRQSPLNILLNQWDKRSFSIHQTWGTSSVNLHSYPYYKYYFRKFFSMKLITGSDFNNAGISCKENLDLWIVLFAHGELISLSLNPFNDSLDAVLHRFKNQKKSYFR